MPHWSTPEAAARAREGLFAKYGWDALITWQRENNEEFRQALLWRADGASDTHCKRGHERAPENTRITKEGWRKCRLCQQLLYRAAYLRGRAKVAG